MLARANRVVRPADFRSVVRGGRRVSSPMAVYYRAATEPTEPVRFGFIVSKAVGGSVERNLLRRRLRSIGREFVDAGARGSDVVIRALPGSAQLDWPTIAADMHRSLDSTVMPR